MASITPLGKPLSQNAVAGANVPLSGAAQPANGEAITPFQWFSLARATWNWILRPLWYLCFKWPTKLLIPTRSKKDEEWWDVQNRRRQAEDDEAYAEAHLCRIREKERG